MSDYRLIELCYKILEYKNGEIPESLKATAEEIYDELTMSTIRCPRCMERSVVKLKDPQKISQWELMFTYICNSCGCHFKVPERGPEMISNNEADIIEDEKYFSTDSPYDYEKIVKDVKEKYKGMSHDFYLYFLMQSSKGRLNPRMINKELKT